MHFQHGVISSLEKVICKMMYYLDNRVYSGTYLLMTYTYLCHYNYGVETTLMLITEKGSL